MIIATEVFGLVLIGIKVSFSLGRLFDRVEQHEKRLNGHDKRIYDGGD